MLNLGSAPDEETLAKEEQEQPLSKNNADQERTWKLKEEQEKKQKQ